MDLTSSEETNPIKNLKNGTLLSKYMRYFMYFNNNE